MVKKERKNNFYKKVLVVFLVLLGTLSFAKEEIFAINSSEITHENQKVLTLQTNLSVSDQIIGEIGSENLSQVPTSGFQLKIPVLMYHYVRSGVPATDTLGFNLSVTPAVLDQQFKYLRDSGFQTISLNDLSDALENSTPLPPKSVILTFDDGYRDFYTDGFQLLKKYNLRAVSFYIVGYFNYPGYMNLDMVKEIYTSGLVDVESHTMSHPELPKLNPEDARREIFESKRILESVLNKKVNYFAYPYGEYNDQIVGLVKEAGYKLAFGTHRGNILTLNEKYFLRRVAVNGLDSLETFKAKVGS